MPENKNMHIRIDVYKPTGKWYTGHEVTNPFDIPLHDSRFNNFITDNLPAHFAGGFVVVSDCADGAGFHNGLLRYDDLFA